MMSLKLAQSRFTDVLKRFGETPSAVTGFLFFRLCFDRRRQYLPARMEFICPHLCTRSGKHRHGRTAKQDEIDGAHFFQR